MQNSKNPTRYSRQLVTSSLFLYFGTAVYLFLSFVTVGAVFERPAHTGTMSTALLCTILYTGIVAMGICVAEMTKVKFKKRLQALAVSVIGACLLIGTAAYCLVTYGSLQAVPLWEVAQYLLCAAGGHVLFVGTARYIILAVT